MNPKPRRLLYALGLLIVLTGIVSLFRGYSVQSSPDPGPALQRQAGTIKPQASPASRPAPPATHATKEGTTPTAKPLTAEQIEEEQHKEIDRGHMRKIRDGIFAYKSKYGNYPEYLSQLVPEFVTADTLVSPRKKEKRGAAILASDHPDPGMEELSYGYEFSNLEFRDGRTFAEIKEVQRSEWGDVVPLLRFFGYDKVINMGWGGEIYETQLNWEWDAATLDVVDKIGWGPGLNTGDMVKVRVVGPDGSPVSGAKVWADGRNYSFDLPNRPFTTGADGYVQIPVGVDHDRTALALRLEASGLTSPLMKFAAGSMPGEATLAAETASQQIGGRLLDESGSPVANTRIFLREATGDSLSGAGTLAQLRTDNEGNWQTTLHPRDAASFSAILAEPGGHPFKFGGGLKVDAADAAAGKAVIVAPGKR